MMLQKIVLIFNTVKYLRWEQVWFRIFYRIVKPKLKFTNELKISTALWKWNGATFSSQSLFENNKVRFLGIDGEIKSDLDWNNPNYEKLWLYNLHYFDDLNSENSIARNKMQLDFIKKWIKENPVCTGNGWEAYPLSLRLVNWVKWCSRQDQVDSAILISMRQQAEALSQQLEYHILGNHLFANAKALVFVGAYLNATDSEKYLALGLKLLKREIKEQFLGDGGHFELSPMYHEILLWDLLELIDLAKVSEKSEFNSCIDLWRNTAKKGITWLHVMTHPDGEIAFFNDATTGIAAKPIQIERYAQSLGLVVANQLPKVSSLMDSGYTRVSTTRSDLFFDHAIVGPDYLPGHAHADTLSFEWSVAAQRVFVNSGTSLYGVSSERLRQRGTAAHNTLVVDGANSSEVWGGFRVARRAKVSPLTLRESTNMLTISAEHYGYRRLPGKVTHRRAFLINENGFELKDELLGRFNTAVAYFYLHPDIQVDQITDSRLMLLGHNIALDVSNDSPILLENSTWHPEFGKSLPNKRLKIEFISSKNTLKVKII